MHNKRAFASTLALLLLTVTAVLRSAEPAEVDPKAVDPAAPADEERIPPAPTHYMGRRIAQTMHWAGADWLTRKEREREEGVSLLEAELRTKIKPGMTVCDLGCGNGFWTLKLSKMVGPEGKVYAVDIQKEMLELLKAEAEKAEARNIVPVLNNAVSAKLPPNSCDLILLVDVYHEFSHPQQMLASMRQALKPGGLIALVEFRAEDDEVPIKPEHKMSKQQILKEYTANGYKPAGEFDKLPWQHVMYFQRGDAKTDPPNRSNRAD